VDLRTYQTDFMLQTPSRLAKNPLGLPVALRRSRAVVGWFACDQWDDENPRKRHTPQRGTAATDTAS
jgi:hypothetical protein